MNYEGLFDKISIIDGSSPKSYVIHLKSYVLRLD